MKKIALLLLDEKKISNAADYTLKELKSTQTAHQVYSARDLQSIQASQYDALIILDDVREAAQLISKFHASSKPIGVFDQGIAVAAEVLGREGVTIAIGKNMDEDSITKTGAYVEACAPDDFVTDRENKVVSTGNDAAGIHRAVAELIEMA